MNIDALLRAVVEREASDLHIKTGSPAVLRIHGALVAHDDSRVTPEEIQEALEHITSEEQRERFARELELDFAYSIPGLARFRVNAALQRGTVSLVFRQVNWRIPPLEELGLPVKLSAGDAGLLIDYMRRDKKAEGGRVRMVLPTGIGCSPVLTTVDDAALLEAMEALR